MPIFLSITYESLYAGLDLKKHLLVFAYSTSQQLETAYSPNTPSEQILVLITKKFNPNLLSSIRQKVNHIKKLLLEGSTS
jgi:hypothetical protein